jgi:hypothetical protein
MDLHSLLQGYTTYNFKTPSFASLQMFALPHIIIMDVIELKMYEDENEEQKKKWITSEI